MSAVGYCVILWILLAQIFFWRSSSRNYVVLDLGLWTLDFALGVRMFSKQQKFHKHFQWQIASGVSITLLPLQIQVMRACTLFRWAETASTWFWRQVEQLEVKTCQMWASCTKSSLWTLSSFHTCYVSPAVGSIEKTKGDFQTVCFFDLPTNRWEFFCSLC